MNEQQTNIEQRLIEYYEGKLEGTAYDEVKAWIARRTMKSKPGLPRPKRTVVWLAVSIPYCWP